MDRKLGTKILVVGVSASGKSLFSRKLSEKVNIPVTHMDAIMWQPGWKYVGDEVTNTELMKISEAHTWLIEGYITKASRPELFDRADTIVYLNYSGFLSAYRYLKRVIKHAKTPREELKGSPDSFSFTFLWLVFTKGESTTLNEYLSCVKDQNKIIRFHSPKEADIFLRSL